MDITWIEVADTAIKIGLGALITAVSGYLILLHSQSVEEEADRRNRFYKLQEEKKIKYVDFLSKSQALVQSYVSSSCDCDTDEYKNYLRAFNEVQILSSDHIRLQSHKLLMSVNEFIVTNKNGLERDIRCKLRVAVDENVSLLQKLVQLEVTKPYAKT